tara:strand:+ start:2993 stop:3121 length:129 start_codon:yes stop_codon:yes gene_type:complete
MFPDNETAAKWTNANGRPASAWQSVKEKGPSRAGFSPAPDGP